MVGISCSGKEKLNFLMRLLRFFFPIEDTTYDLVYGSRKVVKMPILMIRNGKIALRI